VTFSEPLTDRANAANNLQVRTRDGKAISGKWSWIGSAILNLPPIPHGGLKHHRSQRRRAKFKKRAGRDAEASPDRAIQHWHGPEAFRLPGQPALEAVENGKVVRTFKVSTGKSKTPR